MYSVHTCNAYRNGRWRSQWTLQIDGTQAEVTGVLKVQVHYYEDGNVQLVTSKEVKETIALGVCVIINIVSHD